jgi:hypothetical protein
MCNATKYIFGMVSMPIASTLHNALMKVLLGGHEDICEATIVINVTS